MHRDPWTLAGLLALLLLSLGVAALYRSAPQSVRQVRDQAWLAVSPNDYSPQMARARERLAAAAALEADSAAADALAAAAEHAWRARELAEGEEQAAEATTLWAGALLQWADRLRRAGTGTGLRPDDDELLRQALSLVERVLATETDAATRDRARQAGERIQRQLRLGPLEWLPLRR